MISDLTILSNFEQLRIPAEKLRELGSKAGVPEETLGQVELVLQELLANQVEHAYKNNPEGIIRIQLEVNPPNIFIQSEDSGLRADVKLDEVKMPDPMSLAEGGYGMAIITTLMDKVTYDRRDDVNIWKLKKRYT